MFARNDPEVHLDDWLPSLSRAATWNKWFSEELLIQLAGHLKGRALQEWNLLGEDQTNSYDSAIQALRDKLDPGSKVLAGQDYRHTAQLEGETVADFIRHLERAFQVAYGRNRMSAETKETILFGQLLEGLRMKLLRGPAVSGALGYKELCAAAKTEEHRLAELRMCQGYQRQAKATSAPKQPPNISWGEIGPNTQVIPKRRHLLQLRPTWTHCTGLLVPKERESTGRPPPKKNVAAVKPQVKCVEAPEGRLPSSISDGGNDPLSFLYSSDSDEYRPSTISLSRMVVVTQSVLL